MHKHKCKFCGFVWEHHDCNDVNHGNTGAHECPGCHRCNWGMGIYIGNESARIQNGIEGISGTIHPDQNHTFV